MIRLLLVVWLTAGMAHAARVHVLAIGNDVGRSDETPLRFARRDASRFATIMRSLGGARAPDVIPVTDANAQEVRDALHELNARIRRSGAADSALVVYYSGHADAVGLHLGETTLQYDELRKIVEGSAAKVRILILDGCRSGGLTRVKGASKAAAFTIKLEDRLDVEGLAVMTSSAVGEDSHESELLRGSFFTHHLLAALEGAGDRDQDGKVTLTEAYAYTFRNTLHSSKRAANLQHPTYAYDIKGRGDFVLTHLDSGPLSGRLKLLGPGTYLVHEGSEDGPLRSEARSEKAGAVLVLPPGRYFVQQRNADHYREYAVSLQPGQEAALGGLEYKRVAYATWVRKGGATSAHRLFVLGATHGAALSGRGVQPGFIAGYSLDLPWATLSLRGRFAARDEQVDLARSTVKTGGLSVTAERVVDFEGFSLGLGVLVEGVLRSQSFVGAAEETERKGAGVSFGLIGSADVPIAERLSLRFEGGPITHLLTVARTANGAQSGEGIVSRAAWWAAFGVGVHF